MDPRRGGCSRTARLVVPSADEVETRGQEEAYERHARVYTMGDDVKFQTRGDTKRVTRRLER